MDKIYITGHRNPDLDSVCSAAAYAVLKNTTDPDNSYIPVRPGHLSESAKRILSSLDITPPPY
ncbi:MAG: DHH family phosphoesterase, partial [Oscillospiraceae bacterium]|nr:DHH family phosphoesterase [Oscillospiraceae bacterium]